MTGETGWRAFLAQRCGVGLGVMHRGVLRADSLRYILPLIEGGVYSNLDVSSV
jgi:hypothetical protein